MNRRAERGFTVIEMLLVFTIIGLLTAMTVPTYHTMQARGVESVLRADLRAVQLAEESYFIEHGRFTTDPASLDFHPSSGVSVTLSSADPWSAWRAVAEHPTAAHACEAGEGIDAPVAAPGHIVCESPSAP